jgi:nicotinate-nucleotide adenylyltransferase
MEQSSAGKRVAFFGGSFDPPHCGHLAVARAARTALELDTVLFAPVGAQPLKPSGSTASFEDRVAMMRLAIAGEPGLRVSLADAPRQSGEPNFTLETLVSLRKSVPAEGVLFCLMGADAFLGLREWHRAAEIPFVAPLVVASRPGQHLESMRSALPDGLTIEPLPVKAKVELQLEAGPNNPNQVRTKMVPYLLRNAEGKSAPFFVLAGLEVEISASQVREAIHGRSSASLADPGPEIALVPHAVLEYIRDRGLYRQAK